MHGSGADPSGDREPARHRPAHSVAIADSRNPAAIPTLVAWRSNSASASSTANSRRQFRWSNSQRTRISGDRRDARKCPSRGDVRSERIAGRNEPPPLGRLRGALVANAGVTRGSDAVWKSLPPDLSVIADTLRSFGAVCRKLGRRLTCICRKHENYKEKWTNNLFNEDVRYYTAKINITDRNA